MSLLYICLSMLLTVSPVQQTSLLDSIRQKSEQQCVAVSFEFTTTISGVKTMGEGQVHIQGNAYHMEGNGIEIYCDGTSTWMIDEQAKEVFIEAAESQSAGYLANPALLLMNLDEDTESYMVEDNKITVPAFLMKDQPRSQVARNKFFRVGKWYGGSSITNGAGSPENNFVFLSIKPEITIAAIPIK